ncbi:hypothetical protein ENBRE01_1063 [Enteropsectra breve]|nr:hypothetical protein ENBRE01_1063 [Enteropsectra breve]
MSVAKIFNELGWIFILSVTTTLPVSMMLVSTLQRILLPWVIATVFVLGISYNAFAYYLKTKGPSGASSLGFKRLSSDTSIRMEETSFSSSELTASSNEKIDDSELGNFVDQNTDTLIDDDVESASVADTKRKRSILNQVFSAVCHFALLNTIFFAAYRLGGPSFDLFDNYAFYTNNQPMTKSNHGIFWAFPVFGLLSILFNRKYPKLKYIASCVSFVGVFVSAIFLCIEGHQIIPLDHTETNDVIFANIWQPFTLLTALFAAFPFRYTDHFLKLTSHTFAKARAFAMLAGGLTSAFVVFFFEFQFNKIRKDIMHISNILADWYDSKIFPAPTSATVTNAPLALPSFASLLEVSIPFFFALVMLWTLALYVFEHVLEDFSALRQSLFSNSSLGETISNTSIYKFVCHTCASIKNEISRAAKRVCLAVVSEDTLHKSAEKLDTLFGKLSSIVKVVGGPIMLFALCAAQLYIETHEFDYLQIILGLSVFCHFFYFYVYEFYKNMRKTRRETVQQKTIFIVQFTFLAILSFSWIPIWTIMRVNDAIIAADSEHVVPKPFVFEDY